MNEQKLHKYFINKHKSNLLNRSAANIQRYFRKYIERKRRREYL